MESIHFSAQIARSEMAVDLGRQLRITVTHNTLHGRWIGSCHHQQAGSSVPQIVEAKWSNHGFRPQLASIFWAAPQGRIARLFGMPAALAATHVPPTRYDPCPSQGAPEHRLERCIFAKHRTVRSREDVLAWGSLDGALKVWNQLRRNGDAIRVSALRGLTIVRARYGQQARF